MFLNHRSRELFEECNSQPVVSWSTCEFKSTLYSQIPFNKDFCEFIESFANTVLFHKTIIQKDFLLLSLQFT